MANLPPSSAAATESVRKEEVCPGCRRQLEGVVVVSSAMVGGINFVVMEETPDRNWIECDACGKVICKNCCVFPDSGYCDRCYFTYKIEPNLP